MSFSRILSSADASLVPSLDHLPARLSSRFPHGRRTTQCIFWAREDPMLQRTCWQTRSTTLLLVNVGPQDTYAEDRQVSRLEDEGTGGTGSVDTRCRHVVSLSRACRSSWQGGPKEEAVHGEVLRRAYRSTTLLR